MQELQEASSTPARMTDATTVVIGNGLDLCVSGSGEMPTGMRTTNRADLLHDRILRHADNRPEQEQQALMD